MFLRQMFAICMICDNIPVYKHKTTVDIIKCGLAYAHPNKMFVVVVVVVVVVFPQLFFVTLFASFFFRRSRN